MLKKLGRLVIPHTKKCSKGIVNKNWDIGASPMSSWTNMPSSETGSCMTENVL